VPSFVWTALAPLVFVVLWSSASSPPRRGCRTQILYTKLDFVAEVNRTTGGQQLPVL
jgi:hypothetical protein